MPCWLPQRKCALPSCLMNKVGVLFLSHDLFILDQPLHVLWAPLPSLVFPGCDLGTRWGGGWDDQATEATSWAAEKCVISCSHATLPFHLRPLSLPFLDSPL